MQSDPPARPRRRRRWIVLAAVAAVAVAGGIAAAVVALPPGPFTATGSITLMPDLSTYSAYYTPHQSISFNGNDCSGTGGYSDLGLGAGVTVRNAEGTIVGAGEITDSTALESMCMFTFTVPDVPSGEGPYTVEISHRGEVTSTEQALAEGTATYTIGN